MSTSRRAISIQRLLNLLSLEKIEDCIFRGSSYDPGWGRVFGGQVLGQALRAAQMTVASDRPIHSFHSYFLRPGDPEQPIVYDVERVRDGRSISTRRVTAVQKGKKIFHLTGSFDDFVGGISHSDPMPNVVGPDDLTDEQDHALKFADRIPAPLRKRFLSEQPITCRPVHFHDPCHPQKTEPSRHVWLRTSELLEDVEPHLHQCLLAFCSDYNLLSTCLLPHGKSFWRGDVKAATIDHSMWFHGPIDMNTWLLYALESPTASNGRGLARGQIFDSSTGLLVASTAQEGVLRTGDT